MKADKENMDMDELLVKYIAGQASVDERALIEAWIDTGAANKAYFEHFRLLWDESLKLTHTTNVDEDMAWGRLRERIHREYIVDSRPKRNYQWLKVAAVIFLASSAALIGPFFFRHENDGTRSTTATVNNPPLKVSRSVTADHARTDTLPDGSIITLNKYSGVSYPAGLNGRVRNVQLTGEAYFRIKHDPNKPFVVKVNDLLVTVLGTSFNIKSSGNKTEVIVESGVVGVTKQGKSVTLYPDEKLTELGTDTVLKKERNKDTAYRAYIYQQHSYAINYTVNRKTNTGFDINKHPELLQQLLNDPGKWASLLKKYGPQSENLQVRRAVINSVLAELIKENIAAKGTISSFRLNDGEFMINDHRQPEAVHRRFKYMFIKEPGYVIYLGGAPRNGKGIFLSRDSL